MRPDRPRDTTLLSAIIALVSSLALSPTAGAWPLDDADGSNIGRLEYMRRVEAGTLQGTRQPRGALLPTAAVDLRLLDQAELELPAVDDGLSATIRTLLGANLDRYSFAVLDLSDPAQPVYAEHRGKELYNPGSVGKLVVALAWLQALADRFPDDTAARWALLRDTRILADDVIITDSHTVRRWDPASDSLIRRPLEVGDPGSLFEFLDWMISPSSNAAASVLIRQAMLLNHFGPAYPLEFDAATEFFKATPAKELTGLLERTLQHPVTNNGFDIVSLRQGSFFTRTGKKLVTGTNSRASARELMRFLLRLEQGRVVDEFSSRLLKRLMYVTERRIRYAASPALREAAVYFKSGSWYGCKEEPGFQCGKYRGNVRNLMHSVAIVESPAADRRLHYLVVLMSNVLRKNSAEDHLAIASGLQRLLLARHPEPELEAAPEAQAEQQPEPGPGPQAADTDPATAPPGQPSPAAEPSAAVSGDAPLH